MQQVPEMRLIIAGDGTTARRVTGNWRRRWGCQMWSFVGHVGRTERDALIAQSQFHGCCLLTPTKLWERTILESYA